MPIDMGVVVYLGGSEGSVVDGYFVDSTVEVITIGISTDNRRFPIITIFFNIFRKT